MASWPRWLGGKPGELVERDAAAPMSLQSWVELFNYQNVFYPTTVLNQTLVNQREEISPSFGGLAAQAYQGNSVVFACMDVRMSHFSEARFAFRERVNGRAGTLFGSQELRILEAPWPNGTTGDLLARMIQDVDLAGNSYWVRQGDRLARLRPDWTSILLGSRSRRPDWIAGDPDTEIVAYLFKPGGKSEGMPPMTFMPEQVAHFAPRPDPLAFFRGMSWLTPVIREIQADTMMTTHKSKFLEQGATVNLVVKVPAENVNEFNEWVKTLKGGHDGVYNAYKTMYLGGGADATAIGSNLQQMDFRAVQGAGETRIAAAAGVHPVIVALSEGLEGSALNAGNYQAARRRFVDGTVRPLWRNAAGSMASLVRVPNGSTGANELWYDDRDIAFLREDAKDVADVQARQAASIQTYINAGFKPDAAVTAVLADDLSRLMGQHTGLTSVQLQPPSNGTTDGNATMNGKGTLVPA